MKEKIKDVKFWVSLGSSVLLILSFITDNFGIQQEVFVEVYSCVLAILTTLGVLTKNGKDSSETDIDRLQDEIKQEIEDNSKEEK